MRTGLTVYFDGNFWIAIFEKTHSGYYTVKKINLGTSEPTDAEIYSFIKNEYNNVKFPEPEKIEQREFLHRKPNIKKMQKLISKQKNIKRTVTASQEFLAKQRENNKAQLKKQIKYQKKINREEKFRLKQEKKKQKKKGK